ncbi:unnamed protein product [Psylliodes chrysocephalus]|uniref:DNA helicase MCM8 n=1 Tax=Psylliodes chrysocephalus TaxID=3402493 RepID=A0A9P0G7C6_9CUCU|nr:unnamed protein product [Psylliodes chrysocephala]
MAKPWFKRYNSKNKTKMYNGNNPSNVFNLENHGYTGFRLYFPDDNDADLDSIKSHLTIFKNFFEQNQSFYSIENITKDRYFVLDFKLISEDDGIIIQWPNFKTELLENTKYCLKCMGLAMHDLISKQYDNQNENLLQFDVVLVRIGNVEPMMQLRDLRVNLFGKLVTIRGTVIKASHEKLVSQYLTFACGTCSGTQIIEQTDGLYTLPTKCQTHDCKSRSNFSVVHDSPFNRVVSWQSIKIQEVLWTDQQENARTPRTLDCELTEDLVKTCLPGDDVTITGIIKVRDLNSNNNKNKQNAIFNLYLETVSIFNNKNQNKGDSLSKDGITFNQNDYFDIHKIHGTPNTFSVLVNSLCPSIYGHEIVKAGLLLALLGGTKSETFRAESHVLMVGDPGLGKSQMLQACASVAPRGIYVCGNTSTTSGLTVTMTRDGGEYSLEAGALMLADQGCCCIDEFDKMPSQHACLLEAMEQQSISIAKAGIVCSLPTRATILAAANPAGGHYNKAKTVAENLKMSSPMLSRFDLIFILLDQANEARAKAELREVATKQDAADVIDIMKMSLKDIFTDDSGILDKTRSQNGTGTSTKSQITKLLRLLQRISEIETKSMFSVNELRQISEQAGIAKDKFFTVLENINLQGFLLNKGQGKYQLVTASI